MAGELSLARSNFEYSLGKRLASVPSGGEAEAEALFGIAWEYRVLGICALLEDADTEKFSELLTRSGQARLFYLRRVADGGEYPPIYTCTSKSVAFAASLAAGDLEAASAIATLSPQQHVEGVEYEDDFLFYHFLHRCVAEPTNDDELESILERWEVVLAGGTSGYLDACRGLLSEEGAGFDEGFHSLLETREAQFDSYKTQLDFDAQLFAAEGKIFVEGLALLRIAEMRGVRTQPEYPLCPSLARTPTGSPIADSESWRSL